MWKSKVLKGGSVKLEGGVKRVVPLHCTLLVCKSRRAAPVIWYLFSQDCEPEWCSVSNMFTTTRTQFRPTEHEGGADSIKHNKAYILYLSAVNYPPDRLSLGTQVNTDCRPQATGKPHRLLIKWSGIISHLLGNILVWFWDQWIKLLLDITDLSWAEDLMQ